MSIPILIFEPIDLPPDINIIVNDSCSYYVLMESKKLTDLQKTDVILFQSVLYYGNNVNEYLWKISDCNYSTRYLKLEIIERLRCCNNQTEFKKILMYIRQIPIETPSDGEDRN